MRSILSPYSRFNYRGQSPGSPGYLDRPRTRFFANTIAIVKLLRVIVNSVDATEAETGEKLSPGF
jgi:hypothetical protein